MSSSVCLVVTNNSSSIAVRDLIFSFLRASNKDKDLEQSDVIVCLEDSFADSRVENLRLNISLSAFTSSLLGLMTRRVTFLLASELSAMISFDAFAVEYTCK